MLPNKARGTFDTSQLLNRENALLMRQSPKWMQFFAISMLLLGSGMLIAAYLVKIDEVVTATGQLKSSQGRNDIKTPAGGKVAKVFVKNGERVSKGDLLIEFDTTLAIEKKARSEELIRLERTGLTRKLNAISLQKQTLTQRIATQSKILSEYEMLSNVGGIARLNLLDARDKVYGLDNQLTLLDEKRREIEIESQKRIRGLQSNLKEAIQQLSYQKVVSTSSGIVFDIQAAESGVLADGATILSIVPTDGLKAEIFVPNKDIGFVKIGQSAKIRVDAFPANRYGEIDGTVKLIGADALPPSRSVNFFHYPIDIELKTSWIDNKELKIPLRSGMSISSNLIIRDKRIISVVGDFFTGQLNSIKALRN